MPDLIDTIKRAALEATEAAKPVNVVFGQVLSDAPLRIGIEQKIILEKEQLILTRNVTNYSLGVSVSWTYEHGSKSMGVSAALKTGDKVVLLRLSGGQQFLVLDRVVSL